MLTQPPQSEDAVERVGGQVVLQHKVLYLVPFGKARPRVTQNGTYMPREYRENKVKLRQQFGTVLVEGLLKLSVVAVRPMPKSWSQQQRRLMDGEPAQPSPDLDNILGAIMDALFPKNDNHIVSIEAHKIWGELPRMEITIEKMGD